MPLLDGLDFVHHAGRFDVSYRASAEPQSVILQVDTAGKSTRRSGPVCLRKLLDMINYGAAGGIHFAPELGFADRVAGPWDGEDAFGPSYRWSLKLAGVAPEFMRIAVEHLRRCGWDQAVTALRIEGSLALDASAMSLRTPVLAAWLDDTWTYPGMYAPLPFAVRPQSGTGAMFRIELAEALSDAHAELLRAICARWLAATATLVGANGKPFVRTPELLEHMLPSFDREPQAFTARMSQFGHATAPSAALLINMLSRFHAAHVG